MSTTYAVVTFGTPAGKIGRVTRSLERAKKAAGKAKGSGSCSAARVLECESATLARTADISAVRAGERTVFEA